MTYGRLYNRSPTPLRILLLATGRPVEWARDWLSLAELVVYLAARRLRRTD